MLKIYKKSDPFEKRLIEFISAFIAIMMVTVFVLDLTAESQIQNMIMHVVLICIGTLFYYLSRKEIISISTLYKPYLVILYLASTFYWFSSTGIYGPTALGAFCVVTISFIFSKPYNRKYFLYGNIVYVTALGIGQLALSEYMMFGELLYDNIIYEFVIVGYGLIFLLFFLKKEVDKERKTIRMKNEQLVHLNKSLKTTVETQFRTLRELNNTQTKLVESEKMASIGSLTAGLAHELNNPLNFVGGVVGPIKTDIDELKSYVSSDQKEKAEYLSEEIFQLLDSIENGTEKASRVVEKILNITPGREEIQDFHEFNISELVLDITRLVKKSHPEITFELDIDHGITMTGNEIEINQVILNLLRNSIQAIKGNGKINVGLRNQNGAILSVKDNGCGMDENTKNKIFNAFYTTKNENGGTGLGMFIAQSIVKKHKGTVEVKSNIDEGAEISIHFPNQLLDNLNPN